jgi:hypothetical protein
MNKSSNPQQIIRIHTVKDTLRAVATDIGTVYARIMEPVVLPGYEVMYVFIEMVEVPAGLDQQGAVDHFRSQGWTVEQDHGNYEWGE